MQKGEETLLGGRPARALLASCSVLGECPNGAGPEAARQSETRGTAAAHMAAAGDVRMRF
jgi:hypothetical protein